MINSIILFLGIFALNVIYMAMYSCFRGQKGYNYLLYK